MQSGYDPREPSMNFNQSPGVSQQTIQMNQIQPNIYNQNINNPNLMNQNILNQQYMMNNPLFAINQAQNQINNLPLGRPMNFCQNPIEQLKYTKKVMIMQQLEMLEIISGIETNNRYHVYTLNDSEEYTYLFKCKEESDPCERNCCSADCRNFLMKIKHVDKQADFYVEDFSTYYALLDRPFKCTCCRNRPELTAVRFDTIIGKIEEPFKCCGLVFNVKNSSEEIRWKIVSECCQGCSDGCDQYCMHYYPIYKAERTDYNYKQSDGYIKKLFAGVQELISDADNFELVFPETATPDEKFMLICCVLMIDYRYYEINPKRRGNRHGIH